MIILVTRTAVSVVICIEPSLRPWNPFFRSSEVRSTIGQPSSRGILAPIEFYPVGDRLLLVGDD